MSTRCEIGIELEDKSVKAIYCHCDGYIEGVGKILKESYADLEQIEKLFKLGGLSSLGPIPERRPKNPYAPGTLRHWEYFNEHIAHVIEYCDPLDDDDSEPIIYANAKSFAEEAPNDREYLYLFRKGEWRVYKYGSWRKY